jgi:hypothetical protein
MHIFYGHKHDLNMDEVPPTAYEPILSRTTTETETNTVTTATASTLIPAEDETAPLIVRPERAVDSGKNFIF